MRTGRFEEVHKTKVFKQQVLNKQASKLTFSILFRQKKNKRIFVKYKLEGRIQWNLRPLNFVNIRSKKETRNRINSKLQ